MRERWRNTALEMPLNRNVCPPDCDGYFISALFHLRLTAMNDKEQFPALMCYIYDAALDPAQRIDVLEKSASFSGSQACGLLSKHSLGKSENFYCYVGA